MYIKKIIQQYEDIISEKQKLIKIHEISLKKGNMGAKYQKIKAEYAIEIFKKVIQDLETI